MVSFKEAIILSIIQGVTEWFPISSSGHLAIAQNFFGFQNLSYDIFLHLASLFAILFLFKREILKIMSFNKESLDYIILIIIGVIPAGIIGFYFSDFFEIFFYNTNYLGIFFIFSGIVVYSTKFIHENKSNINKLDAFFIGILQVIAIMPGISRSGMTISASLFRGISKNSAIKFSFLMSIPLILGASVLKSKELLLNDISLNILVASFITTFLVSIFTIKILIKIISNNKFYLFGIYNILLGVVILGRDLIL
ncbi:MAG: undecaprenyl-diphosphate phosphatase [Nanoarchaeota archaeon]